METAAPPPADDLELNLLTDWGDTYRWPRTRLAAVFSVAAHVLVIVILILAPPTIQTRRSEEPQVHHIITPLIEPLTELTQKAPNTGKVNKEFNSAEIEPRPRVQVSAPVPSPSSSSQRARRPAPIPGPPASNPPAPVSLPDAPKIDADVHEIPKNVLPQSITAPQPQIQAEPSKPKSPFETPSGPSPNVPAGQSRIPVPTGTVAEAMRGLIRNGGGGGGMVVGDQDILGGGGGASINLPPSAGSPANQLQLLSDPLGVDFRPYLIRVLALVKQHWQAVIPESVTRLGRRGKCAIQFSIARDGQVPKLVIATPSGADALDRAAVAGISASVPFPPLPSDFKGDKIVVQFNFAYNTPKQ